MDVSPLIQFLNGNLETKDKGSKLLQNLIRLYLIEHQHKQLRHLSKSLSGVRKIMKLTSTCKGLTDLSKALEANDTSRKIFTAIRLALYFSGDLNTLMVLGIKLPGVLEAIGQQLKLLWFWKNSVALCITIENNRIVEGDMKEKRLLLFKYVCDILHSTYELGWQSMSRLSITAACISACLCLREEIIKVDWSPMVDIFAYQEGETLRGYQKSDNTATSTWDDTEGEEVTGMTTKAAGGGMQTRHLG